MFASFHFIDWKSSRCIVLCSNSIVSCHLAVCDIRCVPEHKCGRSDETDSSSSKQTVLTWPHANLAPQENVLNHSTYSREDFQQISPPRYHKSSNHALIKKSTLDPSDVCAYRPISNLSVSSKLLERLVLGRVMGHLNRHNLLPEHQSAYRQSHSTKTAVLRVSSDLLSAAGADQMSLGLLDLSAAFDILLGRLEKSFGFMGCALAWFRSYLADRSFSIGNGELASSSTSITCGVPQGSVLDPLLFTIQHGWTWEHHSGTWTPMPYICWWYQPDQTECLSVKISNCVDAISDWMFSSRLQLNASKTEVMWCSSGRHTTELFSKSVVICSDLFQPVQALRNLGIWLDSDRSLTTHINKTTRSCYASLREIRSLAAPLSLDVRKLLITSFILSKIDCGNSTLVGLPAYLLAQLQRIIYAAAKIINNKRKHGHVTPHLHDLHWLRIC